MNGESPEERQKSVSRLENEIREILEKTDRPPSNVVRFKSRVQRDRQTKARAIRDQFSRARLQDIHVLIGALVLSAIGFLLADGSPAVARVCAVLSIAALIWLFVRFYRRPDHGSIKTWRGRDMEFGPPRRPRR